VLDTSVLVKALFSPSKSLSGKTLSRQRKTHESCVALLALLDDHGIEAIIPLCGVIEIAAVATRLADRSISEDICREVEMSFTLIPEEQLFPTAKNIALIEGCPGFDTYFLAISEQNRIPLFTDDQGMHRICTRRNVPSWLVRDMDLESFKKDLS
jgi:hypothetical protein